ncbi:MAG TPA: hypothetical protein VMU34_21995 [Mycobacterium sp.]|nr:hypothetical protein [Mycobacterium sp.]
MAHRACGMRPKGVSSAANPPGRGWATGGVFARLPDDGHQDEPQP